MISLGKMPYVELINHFLCQPECDEALKEMKTYFRLHIMSNRMEDRIRTVCDLIEVLEKRDVLSRENTAPLEEISSFLKKFNPRYVPYNATISRTVPLERPILNNLRNRTSRISCDPEVKAKVYNTIASEIGRNWPTFARSLSMSESCIDDLAHKVSKERVYAILHFHENECDPRKWKSDLFMALIECRRKDLYEKVQCFFDTYKG